MRAQGILTDGRQGFFLDGFDLDPPGPGEVLVELKASGICHTDWKMKQNVKDVVVMGHEGAGIVREAGPGVTRFTAGDHVVLNWAIPCGECFQCRRGAQSLCENKPEIPRERTRHRGTGIRRAFKLGTMATHTVVRQEACVRMDTKVPFASACILGCGVMTGVGSVLNAAKVERGSSVAVIGTGGVGLNCIQGARIAGAGLVIGIDINAQRLEFARRFGATETILADPADKGLLAAAARVRELTGGRGADYAFESTAVPELGAAPLAMIRNGGVAVQASGIEREIAFNMELFEWDKVYINPLYGQCNPGRDFPLLLDFYRTGQLLLDDLVSRTYRMDQLPEAFEDMHAGRVAKGVILIG